MSNFDPQAMNEAAVEAENELADMPEGTVELLANWTAKWYLTAGYRRLGRILVVIAKDIRDKEVNL